MTFNVSPQISVYEEDDTLSVVLLGNTTGAQAGYSRWGPVMKPTLVTGGQPDYDKRFFKPDNNTARSYLIAADFLQYVNSMMFVRVVGNLARNAINA